MPCFTLSLYANNYVDHGYYLSQKYKFLELGERANDEINGPFRRGGQSCLMKLTEEDGYPYPRYCCTAFSYWCLVVHELFESNSIFLAVGGHADPKPGMHGRSLSDHFVLTL